MLSLEQGHQYDSVSSSGARTDRRGGSIPWLGRDDLFRAARLRWADRRGKNDACTDRSRWAAYRLCCPNPDFGVLSATISPWQTTARPLDRP